MACHCNEFSRAHLMRQAVAQAGQRPAVDRAGHADPGRHRAQPALLHAALRGGDALGLRRLEARLPAAAGGNRGGAGGQHPADPGHRLPRGRRRRALDPLPGRPTALQGPAADPRARARTKASSSPRITRCAGIRRPEKLDTLHREGKVTVFPAIGYDDPDQSHFTSRHYWEVGELDPNGRTGWMGRLLDQIGTDDNPLQGLSLDGCLSPALATASKPVAAIDGPSYDLWASRRLGRRRAADVRRDRFARQRPRVRCPTSAARSAGIVGRRASQLRKQLEPFSGDEHRDPARVPGPLVRRRTSRRSPR